MYVYLVAIRPAWIVFFHAVQSARAVESAHGVDAVI